MAIYKITTVIPDHNGSMGSCMGHGCLHFINGVGYTENPRFIDYVAKAGHAVATVDSIPAEYVQAVQLSHRYWSNGKWVQFGTADGARSNPPPADEKPWFTQGPEPEQVPAAE